MVKVASIEQPSSKYTGREYQEDLSTSNPAMNMSGNLEVQKVSVPNIAWSILRQELPHVKVFRRDTVSEFERVNENHHCIV